MHGPILHTRNAQGAPAAITLWNVDSPQRLRVVASLLQRVDSFCFLLRCFPGLPIDTRSAFASVLRHSSDGKGFTTKRVGQQALQSFHLAPFAL